MGFWSRQTETNRNSTNIAQYPKYHRQHGNVFWYDCKLSSQYEHMIIIAVFLMSFTYFHIPGMATTNGVAMGPKKHVIVGTKPDRLGYPKVGYLGPSAIVTDGFGYRRAVWDSLFDIDDIVCILKRQLGIRN
jgi:hypothetical protein